MIEIDNYKILKGKDDNKLIYYCIYHYRLILIKKFNEHLKMIKINRY